MAFYPKSVAYTRMFLLVQSSDHITGLTGATPTVTVSKAGAAFGAVGGTVTEVSSGWYKVALNTTDTNTAGELAFHVTAASGDPTDFADQVYDPAAASLGVNVVNWNGTAVAAPATAGVPDVNVKNINNVAAATPGAAGGLFIAGSNAATTVSGLTTGALSCTTITASGAVAFQSTFAVTTSTSLAALSATTVTFSGAVAFQSTFAVTTSTSLAALSCTTLTASGAVAFQSTFGVTGAATFTGNVALAAGLTVTQSTTNGAGVSITGNGSGAGLSVTGGAAVTTTAAGAGLSVTGGAASASSGGVAGLGFSVTGGAGAASTNGAAGGAKFVGGGTNTVASAAHGFAATGTSTGSGLAATSGGGATGDGITATAASTNGNGMAHVSTGTGSGVLTDKLTASGAVAFQSTFGVTGATSLAAVSTSGTFTVNAFTCTNNFTVSGNWLTTGTTTWTGAATWTNGVTTNVTGNLSGSVGSVTGAVGSVTAGVTVTTNNDKTGYSLAVTPPTAAAIATAVWTDTTGSDFTTLTSPGKIIFAQLGGAFTTTSSSVYSVASLANAPTGGSAPTVSQIATAVWQDSTAGDFTAAGSIGKSLFTSGNAPGAASGLALVGSNVGSATSVSGAVGSVTGSVGSVAAGGISNASFATAPGAAGGLLIAGSNAATTFASLACTGSFTISDGLLVTRSSSNQPAISAFGDGTGAGVLMTGGAFGDGLHLTAGTGATALNAQAVSGTGMILRGGGGGRDLTLSQRVTNLQLPSDGLANVTAWSVTLTGDIHGTLDTLTTYTGNTPQTGDAFARIGASGAGLTAVALSAAGANAVADATLARDILNVEGSAAKYSLAAVAQGSVHFVSGSSTLTVKKQDGSAWFTYSLATTPGADPVTGVT